MLRPKTVLAGFNPRVSPVASSGLANAVAASIALAALSLVVCVGLTIATTVASVALPLTH